MKKQYKFIAVLLLLTMAMFDANASIAATQTVEKPQAQQQAVVYEKVSSLEVVALPEKYLNKNITFDAEFVAFTSLGLDYKPAFREGTKYIGILIRRSNVNDHTIPLSEMKIFLTREMAEKNIDLEAGDKINISGVVFSNALGDPWIDVKNLKITETKNKK